METVFLDTHIVIWIFEGDFRRFTNKGRTYLESSLLVISPISLLELQFLNEIKRLNIPYEDLITTLKHHYDLRVSATPWLSIMERACHHSWTRDPFDRIITAHAAIEHAPLLTKDELIRANYPLAIW